MYTPGLTQSVTNNTSGRHLTWGGDPFAPFLPHAALLRCFCGLGGGGATGSGIPWAYCMTQICCF